jgi:hypothetical protein
MYYEIVVAYLEAHRIIQLEGQTTNKALTRVSKRVRREYNYNALQLPTNIVTT